MGSEPTDQRPRRSSARISLQYVFCGCAQLRRNVDHWDSILPGGVPNRDRSEKRRSQGHPRRVIHGNHVAESPARSPPSPRPKPKAQAPSRDRSEKPETPHRPRDCVATDRSAHRHPTRVMRANDVAESPARSSPKALRPDRPGVTPGGPGSSGGGARSVARQRMGVQPGPQARARSASSMPRSQVAARLAGAGTYQRGRTRAPAGYCCRISMPAGCAFPRRRAAACL